MENAPEQANVVTTWNETPASEVIAGAEVTANASTNDSEALSTMHSMIVPQEDKEASQKPYGVKVMICAMIDELPHELATVSMRASVPFTKKVIDDFISSDGFIDELKKAITEDENEVAIFYMICNA